MEPGSSAGQKFQKLIEIMARLRAPDGCPWDREQTFDSIKPYTLEETYELLDAIDRREWNEVAEELGDFLLQAVFFAEIGAEEKLFTIEDALEAINRKLVRRHPHVFGETSVSSAEEVKDNWEMIKAGEKRASGKTAEPVPDSLPALIRAHRILSRLSQKEDETWNDLRKQGREFARESGELAGNIESDRLDTPDDLGRLLARLVNIARLKGYRAEDILHDFLRKLE